MLILAIDALEYNFIEPRDFPNLKQTVHGKVIIPEECLSMFEGFLSPLTPVIWASFLIGKTPLEHNYTIREVRKYWESNLLNFLHNNRTIHFMYKYLPFRKHMPNVLQKLGFKRKKPFTERYVTFIDFACKPIIIRLPVGDPRWRMPCGLSDFKPGIVMKHALQLFKDVKHETLRRLEEEWDLFITYFKLLDYVGHLYWQRDNIVEKYYHIMDETVKQIKNKIPHEAIVLVVSDHGMMPLTGTKHQGGMHSFHAFASFNKDVGVNFPMNLLDFYPLIIKWLSEGKAEEVFSKKDEEKIKKRLRSLGYI